MKLQGKAREFIGTYIKDIIYGANDGIVTTFAVVAGVVGASLESRTILIIGFATMIADAFSMAASNYLGSRSEQEFKSTKGEECENCTFFAPMLTFVSFVVAGVFPLLPYVFFETGQFGWSVLFTALILFTIGSLRFVVAGKHWLFYGIEMLLIGGAAAGIAYTMGFFISNVVGV